MELSSFSENIITVEYARSGETAHLEINIDAFTPEFFREVSRKFRETVKHWEKIDAEKTKPKPKRRGKQAGSPSVEQALNFFENQATEAEVKRQIHAELLTNGVLKGWDLTENGVPLAPSYEVLTRLSPRLVEDIWNLALAKAKTVKKREDEETEETLDNSLSGTKAPLALAPTG